MIGFDEVRSEKAREQMGRALEARAIILGIAKAEKISMSELAERLGISRQALYKRLEGDMRSSSFIEIIEAMGYRVMCGKEKI